MTVKMMGFTSLDGFDFDPLVNVTKEEEEEEIPSESSLLPDRKQGWVSFSLTFSLSAWLNSHVWYPRQFSSVSLSPSSAAICSGPCVFSTAANILHNTVLCFPGQHCLPACLAHVSPVSRGNSLRLGVGGFMVGKHEELLFVTRFCILFGRDWDVWDQINRDYGDAWFSWFQLILDNMVPSP